LTPKVTCPAGEEPCWAPAMPVKRNAAIITGKILIFRFISFLLVYVKTLPEVAIQSYGKGAADWQEKCYTVILPYYMIHI
jgi:hypothetical protein